MEFAADAPAGRFEYRVFARRLPGLDQRLQRIAERSESEPERRETYLLTPELDRGIKLRGDRVEQKRRIESRLGCQRWRPEPDRSVAIPTTGFLQQPVRKRRRRFWLGDATAEIVRIRVGEEASAREVESAAVEAEDPCAVARWVDALGLRSRANLSYPDYLLRDGADETGGSAMSTEIERKFRVSGDAWRDAAVGSSRITQRYLLAEPERSVRVRRAGERAWLAIKGATRGAVRAEFEYPIPSADALELLSLCERPPIEKTRYRVPHARHVFEVDEFHGDNNGLVVAEVELSAPEEEIELPGWIGEEVTGDARYYNARLYEHPFARWPEPREGAGAEGSASPPGPRPPRG